MSEKISLDSSESIINIPSIISTKIVKQVIIENNPRLKRIIGDLSRKK